MPMDEEPSHGVIPPPPAPAANAHDIQLLADEINSARKVTLYCGSGCRNARKEVMALADKLKAPIGHAWRGKQWIRAGQSLRRGHDRPHRIRRRV